MNLRQITIKDQLELKKVYFDSIQSLDEKIYSKEQKRAWSSQAWNNPNFDKSLIKEIIYLSISSEPKERPNPPPPIATIFLLCIINRTFVYEFKTNYH